MGKSVSATLDNPFVDRSAQLHALTRAEEEACYKNLKERALEYCQSDIKDFVECSKEHNVTVMWTCRDKLKVMNKCLNERTSREQLDQLKLAKLKAKQAALMNKPNDAEGSA